MKETVGTSVALHLMLKSTSLQDEGGHHLRLKFAWEEDKGDAPCSSHLSSLCF